jgi:hypothetical protein
MVSGKLKLFNTLQKTKEEFRFYRVENGHLKGADHAMDCIRYFVLSGIKEMKTKDDFKVTAESTGTYRYANARGNGRRSVWKQH